MAGPIGAGDRTVVVLHDGLGPERIGEAALAAAGQNSDYPEPIEMAPRRGGAGAPIRR